MPCETISKVLILWHQKHSKSKEIQNKEVLHINLTVLESCYLKLLEKLIAISLLLKILTETETLPVLIALV